MTPIASAHPSLLVTTHETTGKEKKIEPTQLEKFLVLASRSEVGSCARSCEIKKEKKEGAALQGLKER